MAGMSKDLENFERVAASFKAVGTEAAKVVTRHLEKTKAKNAAQRKADQREREEDAGVDELRVKLGPGVKSKLVEGCERRGSKGEPYTATEYINTLILRDNELLAGQLKKLDGRLCKNCKKALPRGCGGVWGSESKCLLARSEIALAL